ncbi:MAG TPA: MFS transporter [Caldithrix sp.]|nr:MFS transporter [Calditrichaceae bacterium]HEM49433.1 MFS transporter [Caldithrix sp.]
MKQNHRNIQYYKFSAYGFLKNLRLFDIFFLLFLVETGITYLQIGVLYSIRQIVINIFEVPSGLFADTFGRKKSMLFSLSCYLLSFIIFYRSDSYYYFITAMIIFGLGEAFRSGTHKAIILNYLNKNDLYHIKTQYYGGTRSWSQFGSAISSLLAMIVVLVNQNYRDLFILTAIPYILNLINIATYPKFLDNKPEAVGDRRLLEQSLKMIKENLKEFSYFFKYPKNFKALFSAAAYIAVFKTVKDYLQPILQTIAISIPVFLNYTADQRTAVIIGISFFIIFLLTSIASRNAWRIELYTANLPKSVNLVYLIGIGSIGISGVLLWLDLPIPASIVFIFLYLAQNIRRPLMVSYLSEIISSKIMASGLSTESQLQTALIVIFAPIFGWVVDVYGLSLGLGVMSISLILTFPLLAISSKD